MPNSFVENVNKLAQNLPENVAQDIIDINAELILKETIVDSNNKINQVIIDSQNAYEKLINRGVANGYAPLGANAKIDPSFISSLNIIDTFTPIDEPSMLALNASVGDIAFRQDNSNIYILVALPASSLGNWKQLNTIGVQSVNGSTGVVVLDSSNISEGTNKYYTDERVDDRVGTILTAGTAISIIYNDSLGTITITGVDAYTKAEIATVLSNYYTKSNVDSGFVAKDSSTGSAQIPSGTTAQRPLAPIVGSTRYNTTLLLNETWNGSAWIPSQGKLEDTLGTPIASDSTITIGTSGLGDTIHITGTTTITSLGNSVAGVRRTLIFDGVLTLTHNATSLILPDGANITTAVGDSAEFVCDTTNNWRLLRYTMAITPYYTKPQVDTLVSSVNTTIEQTTTPIFGLIWNQTDDMYKRIGKNINTQSIDGFNEFTAWRSVTAERQNDNDTVSPSPLTKWLDETTNLPYSSMKRYVIGNTGAEVKAYNANSFTHADQTGVTATQQVMVKIPKFNYIQAKVVDGGKTYHLYAVAKEAFTLDALIDLGFTSPTVTVWNPIAGVSSGTVASNVISSALHPAFTTHAGDTLNQRYYGAFNAVSGRSICGTGIKPTTSIALATARTQCQGFGTGFTQLDFFLESAKNILAVIERGSLYFERGGTSLGNKWEGNSATYDGSQTSYNRDNGLTLALLNKTGVVLDGSNRTIANSYRGIENYHSALWRWIDGVSLSANKVYLAKPKATFSDGTITAPYFDSGYTVPSGASASYIADLGAGSFIPVTLGGSASTKVTDGAWTGSTALCVGGNLAYASTGGLCAWSSDNAASYVNWNIVSRSGL